MNLKTAEKILDDNRRLYEGKTLTNTTNKGDRKIHIVKMYIGRRRGNDPSGFDVYCEIDNGNSLDFKDLIRTYTTRS